MLKEITPVSLLMFLALVLAPKSGWATEVDFSAPGLPEVLSFHLEDGRHQTPGLTLSWALPSKLEYGCREITFREERRGGQIRIELLGVARATNYDHCRLAKSPVPIEKWIMLPADPGRYEIVFVRGKRSDTYTLNLRPESVELEAKGNSTFTSCEESGRLMRVGLHWLWVDFSFLSDEPLQRLTEKRDAVLGDLVAMGAKPFTPPPGRYLFNGFGRQVPREPQSHTDEEEYFFQWHGDWLNLQKIANRYRKCSAMVPKRPMMRFRLESRDHVIWTSNGDLWSFIQEKASP